MLVGASAKGSGNAADRTLRHIRAVVPLQNGYVRARDVYTFEAVSLIGMEKLYQESHCYRFRAISTQEEHECGQR